MAFWCDLCIWLGIYTGILLGDFTASSFSDGAAAFRSRLEVGWLDDHRVESIYSMTPFVYYMLYALYAMQYPMLTLHPGQIIPYSTWHLPQQPSPQQTTSHQQS